MKKLFLLLSLCCISFAAWADEYTDGNGVTWEYNLNTQWDETTQTNVITGAVITKCSNYGTEIVVPEAIQVDEESHNVVSLDGSVFNDGREQQGSVTSVTLPSTLKRIGWNVFNSFSSLKSLNIPEGVTSIGGDVFWDSHDLVLTLPTSLQSVESGAFRGCKTISLPSTNPTSLGNNISSECVFDEVSYIAVPDDAIESYKSTQIWTRYAEKICGHSEIIEYTHTDDNGITWTYCYVLSNSSVRIVKAEGYTTDIDAPATLPWKEQQLPVKAIECSFRDNANITTVDLSKTSITTAPSFQNCSSLETVSLPSTLESIGEYAFQNCDNLQSIDLSATKVKKIKSNAFNSCDNLSTIVFPATLETIGDYAFQTCQKIESIDLSNTNLTTIGSMAFYDCYALKSVSFPTTLKEIKNLAFGENWRLSDINLSMVEKIGEEAFRNIAIQTADLSSAKEIGARAFTNDATFTINATTPATIKANSFSENSKFIVNPNGYDTFCSANIWKNWANNISMYTIGSDNIKWIYRYLADSNSMCITSASGYGKEVTIPGTLPYNGTDVAVTQIERAFNGAEITSVVLPTTLTHIGNYAFAYSQLASINIPASVTTIGNYAFCRNSNLTSITFESNSVLGSIGDYAFAGSEWNHEECNKLASIEIPASVKSIGEGAFQYCRNLNSIDLSKVEAIGDYAFRGCNLKSIDLSSATSIGNNAFGSDTEVFFTINNNTPATIESGAFPTNSMFLVPGSAITDYKTANVWSDYASRIFGNDVAIQNITLSAQADRSDLEVKIGDDNLSSVVNLTIKGSINSYDFMVMRNKMPFLRRLNLSEAHIVENNYEHYTGYHTEDNKFPGYGLYNCKLITLELPQGITEIGYHALASISYLSEVVIPVGVTTIGERAFDGCTDLKTVIIPEGVTELGYAAFSSCHNLETINIPKGVTSIPGSAFEGCSNLKSIVLPPTIEFIGGWAFSSCINLKELRIPSSVRRIEDYAFRWTNIDDVYVYVIEPFDINQQTFAMTGNNFIGTLHAPKVSYWSYYYNTQWSQFLDFEEFDEPYENFYLEGDKDLNKETGGIRGEEGENPDAELGDASGLTVKDDIVQDLGNVDIEHNGEDGASMIVDGTGGINAESLNVHINVQSGRWYFFCFPFDLKKENISMGKEGTQYIFRWYDGKERANGNSGWKNVTEEEGSYLKAATGYIFQCSQSDVLTISLKDVKFKKEKKYNELVASTAENLQDASWNFVGNPYLSYYDMNSVGYDAPITIWNGHTYEAIKPGDDDYHFAPFEAFFVQKPEGTAAMEFDADAQTTLQGSQTETRASGARSITRAFNPDRRLINIVLSNGKASDRTRIVFNDKVSMEYELECDAAKFDAAGVPQLYTLDSRAVKYAINERPVAEGIVTLGYSVPAEGNYTLEAPRMDTKVFVKDNLTRTIHDFSVGNYEFYSEAGTFEGRFTILTKSGATGIDKVGVDEEDEKIYNLNGQRVNEATGKGIYIKNNRKKVNM